MRLTHDQVLSFHRDGFIKPLDAFSPTQVQANAAAYESLAKAAKDNGYGLNGLHTSCASIANMALHPAILDAVESLIGPEFVCWGSHFLCKNPGDPHAVTWHQDGPYWPLTPGTITAWIAIDDVDESNSAMRVVTGSHLRGVIPTRASAPEEKNIFWTTIDQAESIGAVASVNLKAGQFSLHHDLMVHGSLPNQSNRRRCGLTVRYAPLAVRSSKPDWANNALRGRGQADPQHWILRPVPTTDAPTHDHAVIGAN